MEKQADDKKRRLAKKEIEVNTHEDKQIQMNQTFSYITMK